MLLALVEEAFRGTIPEPEAPIQEPLACPAAFEKVEKSPIQEFEKVEKEETPVTTNNATEIAVTPNGRLELVKTRFTQELRKFCSVNCLLLNSKVFNRSVWLQMA